MVYSQFINTLSKQNIFYHFVACIANIFDSYEKKAKKKTKKKEPKKKTHSPGSGFIILNGNVASCVFSCGWTLLMISSISASNSFCETTKLNGVSDWVRIRFVQMFVCVVCVLSVFILETQFCLEHSGTSTYFDETKFILQNGRIGLQIAYCIRHVVFNTFSIV